MIGTDDYLLTKKRVVNRFQTDLNNLFLMDSIFLFNVHTQDVTFVTKQDYYLQERLITEKVPLEMTNQQVWSRLFGSWFNSKIEHS